MKGLNHSYRLKYMPACSPAARVACMISLRRSLCGPMSTAFQFHACALGHMAKPEQEGQEEEEDERSEAPGAG